METDLAAAAGFLREETAELFALAHRAASPIPPPQLRGVYILLRTAQELELLIVRKPVLSQPICIPALCEKFLADADFVCPKLLFSLHCAREPLFCRTDVRRFLLCLCALMRSAAVGCTPISVTLCRRSRFAVLCVDSLPCSSALAFGSASCISLYAAKHFALCSGGNLLAYHAKHRHGCAFCLPLCPAHQAADFAADWMRDPFSPLYVGLSPWCELPHPLAARR